MSIAILGANGMLGRDMVDVLSQRHRVVPFLKTQLDITNADDIVTALSALPDLKAVINCAAYTNVDGAETESDRAFAINETGPKNVANWCKKNNRILVHFSTDYIFDGTGSTPWTETDTPNPINVYGASKLAGEIAITTTMSDYYIFRVQWLYGKHGKNFISTMTGLLNQKDEVSVVDDQVGTPTWTRDIAQWVNETLALNLPFGIYHAAPDGYASWFEITQFLARHIGSPCKIFPIPSTQMPRPAHRPKNSRLNLKKIKSTPLISNAEWQKSVAKFVEPYK